jgi:hypothetical protein
MYNTPASTRLRRDSKPSPPQRSDTKKQNIMSSPTFQSQADHHSSQAGISTSIKAATPWERIMSPSAKPGSIEFTMFVTMFVVFSPDDSLI